MPFLSSLPQRALQMEPFHKQLGGEDEGAFEAGGEVDDAAVAVGVLLVCGSGGVPPRSASASSPASLSSKQAVSAAPDRADSLATVVSNSAPPPSQSQER